MGLWDNIHKPDRRPRYISKSSIHPKLSFNLIILLFYGNSFIDYHFDILTEFISISIRELIFCVSYCVPSELFIYIVHGNFLPSRSSNVSMIVCFLFEHVSTMFSWKPLINHLIYVLLRPFWDALYLQRMLWMENFSPSWTDFIWFIRFEIAHGIIISKM